MVNDEILKIFCISNIYIFLNKNSKIFHNSMIKSIIHITKHHKNVQNFLTSLDRKNRKKRCERCLIKKNK